MLKQLVSPEIFAEIQSSFLKKHGAAIGIFENTLQPVADFPENIPALSKLTAEQQNLFNSFFDLSSLDIDSLQHSIKQSFSNNTLCRCVFPITFNDDFMGLAVILRFAKTIHPERDDHLLQTLSLVKHKSISLKTIQDEKSLPDDQIKALTQELQNIIQLFLEAGLARAHVSSEPEQEEKHETAGSSAILFCAPDGQIMDSDTYAAELLGYNDPGDLCDLNFLTDLVATDYDREKIRMLFEAQPAATTSVALILKDGTTVQIEAQVNVQKTAAGIVGFECQFTPAEQSQRDSENENIQYTDTSLTYDKKHLADVQEHYRRLQHQLTRTITPLTYKLDKFFKVQVDDPAIKQELADIQQHTKALSHLNQQLACFALKDAPDCTTVDVNALLKNIASQLGKWAPPSITIKTLLADNPATLSANSELLVHAIGTLCKNALEAMQGSGTLLLQTRCAPDKIDIIITDSGTGFPTSIQRHLFEPFHTTKTSINAGLGLAAVYGIVKSHHGEISILRENDRTHVMLQFPAATDSAEQKTPAHNTVDVKGYVLIVDDEKEIAEVTAMALRRANYGVFTCGTCEEAFDVIDKVGHKLNLFILDNQLVGTKGTTCAQDMLSKAPDIPILFYSGAENDLELMDFIKHIGAGWLKKPFSAKELVLKVDSLIR